MCVSDLEVHGVGSEHVAVKRFAHFVDGRLPPASGVITKRTVLRRKERKDGMQTAQSRLIKSIKLWIIPTHIWDGGVEAGDLEIGVGGRGSVPLHGDQPGRGDLVGILGENRGCKQHNHGFIFLF